VEVFDTRAGLVDGAGIESVTFRIVYEDTGEVKWEKVEAGPATVCSAATSLPARAST